MPAEQLFIIDAFTSEPCAGNSAGVIVDADGLTDLQMQAIAREINSAETTFITQPVDSSALVNFRWFTPAREVEFCGHATLAGVHALLETGRFKPPIGGGDATLRIETRFRGIVSIRVEQPADSRRKHSIWIDMPPPTLRPCHLPIAEVVGLVGGDRSVLDPELPAADRALCTSWWSRSPIVGESWSGGLA